MWRTTPRLATAALTALLALAPATAQASAIQSYSYTTSGSISGKASGAPINFVGVTTPGNLITPGSFILGQFDAAAILPPTATLTYANTPFTVDLYISRFVQPGTPVYLGPPLPLIPPYDYKISGVLNGSITGAGTSDMVATVTSISGPTGPTATPPFTVDNLRIATPQGIAAPYTDAGGFPHDGLSLLTGQVLVAGLPLPAPAPEPTSVAAFAVALAAWGLRRRLRARD